VVEQMTERGCVGLRWGATAVDEWTWSQLCNCQRACTQTAMQDIGDRAGNRRQARKRAEMTMELWPVWRALISHARVMCD
jgi:hypothetical protein